MQRYGHSGNVRQCAYGARGSRCDNSMYGSQFMQWRWRLLIGQWAALHDEFRMREQQLHGYAQNLSVMLGIASMLCAVESNACAGHFRAPASLPRHNL